MDDRKLSKKDLCIEELNLKDVKGGQTVVVYSGRGYNAVTGQYVDEYMIGYDDGKWETIYQTL